MLAAANQVPLWAALLIGLGGGVIGTLVAQGLERGAEMRTRMLQAADDYLSAAIAAERAAEDLKNAFGATPRPAAALVCGCRNLRFSRPQAKLSDLHAALSAHAGPHESAREPTAS